MVEVPRNGGINRSEKCKFLMRGHLVGGVGERRGNCGMFGDFPRHGTIHAHHLLHVLPGIRNGAALRGFKVPGNQQVAPQGHHQPHNRQRDHAHKRMGQKEAGKE